MKNTIKGFGIVALVAIVSLVIGVTSCSNVGGTLTIVNGTSDRIYVYLNGDGFSDNIYLESGKSKKYTYEDNREGTIRASEVDSSGGSLGKTFTERFVVEGNKDTTVTVKWQ